MLTGNNGIWKMENCRPLQSGAEEYVDKNPLTQRPFSNKNRLIILTLEINLGNTTTRRMFLSPRGLCIYLYRREIFLIKVEGILTPILTKIPIFSAEKFSNLLGE